MVTSTSSTSPSGRASIDVAAVVKELMTVENKPLEAISAKIKTNSLVISDLGQAWRLGQEKCRTA